MNKEGEAFFVEVKERTNKVGRYFFSKAEWDKLKTVLDYWNAILVLVTAEEPFFRVFDHSVRNSFIPIEKCKKFQIDSDELGECDKLAKKYFQL